tara:strand:+ start:142 stop:624 length:483 start_codon:yes stop_codon:yes gene_type:complete
MKDLVPVAITVALLFALINHAQTIQSDEAATAEAAAEAAAAAVAETARIEAMYVDEGARNVEHDGDPETTEYTVMLDGRGSIDPDRDSLTYEWAQTSGRTVELSSTDGRRTEFTATAGDYSFSLTVTDSYGASSVANRDIRIGAEMNLDPVADIKAYNID